MLGLEVSHNVSQNVGKPAFLLTGAHHAREWPTPEFTLEFVCDLLLHDGTDPGRDEPAREGQADRGPARQPGRLRHLAPPGQRAEAQELPRPELRLGGHHRGPVRGDRELVARHRQQPQLPAVLGRPRARARARPRATRAGARRCLSPRTRTLPALQASQPDHRRDQQPHARPAAAAGAELVQRAADRGRPRGLRRPARAARDQPPGLAVRPVDRRLLRGVAARPSSRPTTRTARSASRPRRRRASAARRRSTRRTRT